MIFREDFETFTGVSRNYYSMKLSQFSFDLDYRKNIAPYPSEYRDECRMLVLHRSTGDIEHKIFKDIIN